MSKKDFELRDESAFLEIKMFLWEFYSGFLKFKNIFKIWKIVKFIKTIFKKFKKN